MFLYANTCIYTMLKVSSYWQIQLSPSTTWMDLIPHLSIISYSNSEKPGSWHLSSTYLTAHFQYMCMVASVLTLPVWDSTLSTRVQFLCTVPFAFNYTDPLISSYLPQHLSSTLFSEAFHTFLTYSCHRVLVWMLPSLPSYSCPQYHSLFLLPCLWRTPWNSFLRSRRQEATF